jgi:hypothetical protein
MKSHEQKKACTKQEHKGRGKQRAIKKSNKKRRKDNKTLSPETKMGQGKKLTKGNKRKEPKIKVLTHEWLAFTLSYLMIALW